MTETREKKQQAGGSAREVAALDELERLINESVPRLNEDVFLRQYLPLFASQETDVDLSSWLDVCGNAYMPVDIVRDGEVVYRIPPLVKQMPIEAGRRRGEDSIFEVLETAAKKSMINPHLGQAYLDNELDRRIVRLSITPDEVQFWNDLFTRNGYPPLVENLPEHFQVEANAGSAGDLFADGFEEL